MTVLRAHKTRFTRVHYIDVSRGSFGRDEAHGCTAPKIQTSGRVLRDRPLGWGCSAKRNRNTNVFEDVSGIASLRTLRHRSQREPGTLAVIGPPSTLTPSEGGTDIVRNTRGTFTATT